jgi:hypothetical protein
MNRFCTNCGSPAPEGAIFCGGCGVPIQAPRAASPAAPPTPPPAAPPPPQYNLPPQPVAAQPSPYSVPPLQTPPPPPPAAWGAPPAPPEYAAPPPPQYAPPSPPPPPAWGGPPPGYPPPQSQQPPPQQDFAASVASKSDAVLGPLNLKDAQGNVFAMMIRAAMLDGNVARTAAADENGNGKALTALLLAMVAPALTGLLFMGGVFRGSMIGVYGLTLLFGLGGALLSLVVMSAVSQSIVGRKLTVAQMFRGLAYAQSPALLGIIPIPVLAQLVGLWRIPTTLVALRDMAGTTLGKAFCLLLVGALVVVVISIMLLPLVIGAALF